MSERPFCQKYWPRRCPSDCRLGYFVQDKSNAFGVPRTDLPPCRIDEGVKHDQKKGVKSRSNDSI